MEIQGTHFIGSHEGVPAGDVFYAVDPETGEKLEPLFRASEPEAVDQAVALAAEAFEAMRRTSGEQRSRLLDTIADELEALGDALIERAQRETALPAARLVGERGRTCAQLRMFAGLLREGSWVDARIDRAQPERQPVPKPDLRRMRVAMGPVAVFGASNFPLAFSVAGGDTASALAAGCPVVVKAHPAHPGTSELTARAILRAARACGMHDGVFSMVHGGADTSLVLVKHPLLEAVAFTGSAVAGRALFDAAAARPRPIPVFCEMGSMNPVFVLDSALASGGDSFAEGYVQSLGLGVGQFCTNPGLLVGTAGRPFETLLNTIADLVGNMPEGTMLSPGIGTNYARSLEKLGESDAVSKLTAAGGVCEGTHVTGALFEVAAGTFLSEPQLSHEVFGPAALAVTAADPDELRSVARSLAGQLTATVHCASEDPLGAELLGILTTKAGRVLWGGFPTGVEVCPSMQHGGPYPATTDPRFTSVGTAAIERFVRPVAFQGVPQELLLPELQDGNPLGIERLVDGERTR